MGSNNAENKENLGHGIKGEANTDSENLKSDKSGKLSNNK